MTIISNTAVSKYVPGESLPFNSDHHLVTLTYRRPDNISESDWAKNKPDAVCISVRKLNVTISNQALKTWLEKALQAAQANLFKIALEDKPVTQRIGVIFSDADFNEEAIALLASRTKETMTAADYEVWFKTAMQADDKLLKYLLSQGYDAERAAKSTVAYLDTFKKFASPAFKPSTDEAAQKLIAALKATCDLEQDNVAERLSTRLTKVLTSVKAEDNL